MPFSELTRFAKGKVYPTQHRTSNLPRDNSFQGDRDCCELIWANGQVTMCNQSIRERKGSSSSNNLHTIISKPQDAKNSRAKYNSAGCGLNDFPLSAPPCDMTLDEEDDTVPWLNSPVVEPFNNVYCADILPESFGVSGNAFAHSNSTAKVSRHGSGGSSSFTNAQQTMPRSVHSDLACSEAAAANTSHVVKLQKNNSGITNFSYFSRFASHSGANIGNTATNDRVAIQNTGNEIKGNGLSGHNHMESTFVNSSVNFSQQESAPPPKLVSSPPQHSVVRCQEPAIAASSVCSGNSLERGSSNPPSNLKRKFFETGDSEGPSEEVEDESVGIQKSAPSRSGSKRTRAAEVHNLSERRRRERINEKMRALQELIPNCNKVDKASMLDEAIEYLKTLQLQILSMGTGMYMSQMMLPAAMQHMHRAHMPQFSAMGMGMGAALGFGMSMQPDVNSMMQMPCIQPPCFPISGSSGFYGAMGNSTHQASANLGQGITPSMPLINNSQMNQGPNQETMVRDDQCQASNVNEAQNARG
ncbi:hypothetical protein V2J09_007815 [Rumex salicifolius]